MRPPRPAACEHAAQHKVPAVKLYLPGVDRGCDLESSIKVSSRIGQGGAGQGYQLGILACMVTRRVDYMNLHRLLLLCTSCASGSSIGAMAPLCVSGSSQMTKGTLPPGQRRRRRPGRRQPVPHSRLHHAARRGTRSRCAPAEGAPRSRDRSASPATGSRVADPPPHPTRAQAWLLGRVRERVLCCGCRGRLMRGAPRQAGPPGRAASAWPRVLADEAAAATGPETRGAAPAHANGEA